MAEELVFKPVLENQSLVASSVFDAVKSWQGPEAREEFLVAEIDPQYLGGEDLCRHYGVDPLSGANCLVVKGVRGEKEVIASCIVPVGYKYNMNGAVRKALGVRMVSIAPLDFVLAETKMEHGSITPIGLPDDWIKFIDPLVFESQRIIVGGGLQKSKLSIRSSALLALPNAQKLEGLAKAA